MLAHYRHADTASFALHDAQLVLARAYGFDSWTKLKAFVDGITVRRFIDAVRDGDLDAVRSMVTARPEAWSLTAAIPASGAAAERRSSMRLPPRAAD